MAELADKGKKALEAEDYDSAVELYTSAIHKTPNAIDYHIKRSIAYQRSRNSFAALQDSETALKLAHKAGRRNLLAQAQLRRGIALVTLKSYANAKYVLQNARELAGESGDLGTIDIWLAKADNEMRKLGDSQDVPNVQLIPSDSVIEESENEPTVSSRDSQQEAPSKVRHEWYQSDKQVMLSLFVKGVNKDSCRVEFTDKSVSVSFPLPTSGSEFLFDLPALYSSIDPSKSRFNITPSKIEVALEKAERLKWKSLEDTTSTASNDTNKDSANQPRHPTTIQSSPAFGDAGIHGFGKKNWDKLAKDIDEEEAEGDQGVNALFQQIYKDADDDTKRAMMKSYVESSGTTLSTNWADVKKGPVATNPPDGMEARPWNS